MTFPPLGNAEVDELERRVDDTFEAAPLPAKDRLTSRRAVLIATEDQLRLQLMEAARTVGQPATYRTAMSGFIHLVDRSKYALKAALELIDRREVEVNARRYPDTSWNMYVSACKLVFKYAESYATAVRIISPVRAGQRHLERRDDGKIFVSRSEAERTYPALEGLINVDGGDFSPLPEIARIFRGPEFQDDILGQRAFWPPSIHAIVRSATVKNDRVVYVFDVRLAQQLLNFMPSETTIIPHSWQFPWGNKSDVAAVFSAIQVRALYHLLAIHFAAADAGLEGVGADQICLETTEDQLINDAARISALPLRTAREVVNSITYGFGVRNPDPALQPIIQMGRRRLIVPPILVLSSNWERNILSLHARIDATSFDSQSHQFEQAMTKLVAKEIPHPIRVYRNVHLDTGASPEEIDLILIDQDRRFMLLIELRWMLQPGDIREVLMRKQACREKGRQIRRKRNAVRTHFNLVATQLKLDSRLSWDVEGLVIIDDFGGTPSEFPKEVPIVPRKIFEVALRTAPDLRLLHAAFTTTAWLPRAGEDFFLDEQNFDLGGVEVVLPTFTVAEKSYMRQSLPDYLRELYGRNIKDLLNAPW